MPAIEQSALGRGLALLADRGMLGAENRRGLGRVRIALESAPDPEPYDQWLADSSPRIREYLAQIGALAK